MCHPIQYWLPYTKAWKQIKTMRRVNLSDLLSLRRHRQQYWGGMFPGRKENRKEHQLLHFCALNPLGSRWELSVQGHCYSMYMNFYWVNERSLLTLLFHTSTFILWLARWLFGLSYWLGRNKFMRLLSETFLRKKNVFHCLKPTVI